MFFKPGCHFRRRRGRERGSPKLFKRGIPPAGLLSRANVQRIARTPIESSRATRLSGRRAQVLARARRGQSARDRLVPLLYIEGYVRLSRGKAQAVSGYLNDPQPGVVRELYPWTAMCVRNVDVHVSCSSQVDAQLAAFFIDPRAK